MGLKVFKRFNIGSKIAVGYVILTTSIVIYVAFGIITLQKSKSIDNRVHLYTPVLNSIEFIDQLAQSSGTLSRKWLNGGSMKDKEELLKIHNEIYPEYRNDVVKNLKDWDKNDNPEMLLQVIDECDKVIDAQRNLIQKTINNNGFYVDSIVEENYDELDALVSSQIIATVNSINILIAEFIDKNKAQIDSLQIEKSDTFAAFEKLLWVLGIALILFAIFSAVLTTRIIVKPVLYLKDKILTMSKGELLDEEIKAGKDEIGDMAKALNLLMALFIIYTFCIFAKKILW
ncbi:MAG: hypothetical protein HN347_18600, partial [Bacteroidetes bacterium]|nr:hypothetical protein [Bacteroidota bacterium]